MLIPVNNKESIIYDLYNILLKLRYPEVAQTSFKEFESTILTGTKRIDLLCYVLQKNLNINSEPLNKFKDNSIKNKLVKCYTQIGLCADENILLGSCDTNKQLDFLHLLTIFVKNVHLTEPDTPKNHQNINNFSKTANEITHSILPFDVTESNIEADSQKNECSTLIENTRPCIDSLTFTNELCLNLKKKTNDLNDDHKNWSQVLQDFNWSFKKIVSLPSQEDNSNIFSSSSELSTDIQKVCSTFSIVNKTLINKSQIKKQSPIENMTKDNKFQSELLQNNLVLIEQACNLRHSIY